MNSARLVPRAVACDLANRLVETRSSEQVYRLLERRPFWRGVLLSFVWYGLTDLSGIFNARRQDYDQYVRHELSAFDASYPRYGDALCVALELSGVAFEGRLSLSKNRFDDFQFFSAPSVRERICSAAVSAVETVSGTNSIEATLRKIGNEADRRSQRKIEALDKLDNCKLEWIPRARVKELTGISPTSMDRKIADSDKQRGDPGGLVKFRTTAVRRFVAGWTSRVK